MTAKNDFHFCVSNYRTDTDTHYFISEGRDDVWVVERNDGGTFDRFVTLAEARRVWADPGTHCDITESYSEKRDVRQRRIDFESIFENEAEWYAATGEW